MREPILSGPALDDAERVTSAQRAAADYQRRKNEPVCQVSEASVVTMDGRLTAILQFSLPRGVTFSSDYVSGVLTNAYTSQFPSRNPPSKIIIMADDIANSQPTNARSNWIVKMPGGEAERRLLLDTMDACRWRTH